MLVIRNRDTSADTWSQTDILLNILFLFTCPEEAALDGALPPVSWLLDDVMHGVEHEGEEDDQEAGHRHQHRPGAVPQGDGAVRAAADVDRAPASPVEVVILEAGHLGQV